MLLFKFAIQYTMDINMVGRMHKLGNLKLIKINNAINQLLSVSHDML